MTMNKMKLGNDFNEDSESDTTKVEESDQKTSEETQEDEDETSANSDNGKKTEETDEESTEESEEESEEEEESESEEETEEEEESEEDKAKILQGLENTEKDLDENISDIDVKIKDAKKRISDKRKDRRGKRELVETIDNKFPEDTEQEDDLSDIDPTTLEVLDRFTKAKGLVPKSELKQMNYQDKHTAAQEEFYANNPEYLPENDPDDVLYNALKEELSFFAAPKDAKLIPKLFERAHQSVVNKYPDKFNTKQNSKTLDKDKVTNKKVRIKAQSVGGKPAGGKGSSKSESKKSFSKEQIRALEDGGWSKEDIDRLTN